LKLSAVARNFKLNIIRRLNNFEKNIKIFPLFFVGFFFSSFTEFHIKNQPRIFDKKNTNLEFILQNTSNFDQKDSG